MIEQSDGMSPELRAALERVKGHVMTPEEIFEQQVSFVYGNLSFSSTITKDEVRARLMQHHGVPAEALAAAKLEGVRLGIEAAAKVADEQYPKRYVDRRGRLQRRNPSAAIRALDPEEVVK